MKIVLGRKKAKTARHQTQTAKNLGGVAGDPIIPCDQSSRKKPSEADVTKWAPLNWALRRF